MLKLTVAMLAVALAGTAAAGWRDLRVDGSSEDAFEKSLEAFREELSPARRYVFGEALKDIWLQGARQADAEQREYTAAEYYRQLHDLRYEEVVKLTDPSGDTAKDRYRTASLSQRYSRPAAVLPSVAVADRQPPPTWNGQQVRGLSDQMRAQPDVFLR
jgi:hypothetical protein